MSHAQRIFEEHDMARSPSKPARVTKAPERPTIGFGVPATTDPHHFIVDVPKSSSGAVSIIESLGLQAQDQQAGMFRLWCRHERSPEDGSPAGSVEKVAMIRQAGRPDAHP